MDKKRRDHPPAAGGHPHHDGAQPPQHGRRFFGALPSRVSCPPSPPAPPSGGKPVDSADGKMPAQPSDGKTAGGQPAAKAEKTEVVEPLPKGRT